MYDIAEEIIEVPVAALQGNDAEAAPHYSEFWKKFEPLLLLVVVEMAEYQTRETEFLQEQKDRLVCALDRYFPELAAYLWVVADQTVASTAHLVDRLTIKLGAQPMLDDFQWRNTDVYVHDDEGDAGKLKTLAEALRELRKVGFPDRQERRIVHLPSGARIRMSPTDMDVESKAYQEEWSSC